MQVAGNVRPSRIIPIIYPYVKYPVQKVVSRHQRDNPVSYRDTTSPRRPPCTDLGVNSLHRSVPVGLGLGDTVSVSCFMSKPPNQFPSLSPAVCLPLQRAFLPFLRLTLGGLVVAIMRETKHISFSAQLHPLEHPPAMSSTHAVWFFDLAILTR